MKQKSLLILAFCLTTLLYTFSQNITISGSVTDGKNGEDLFGASVIVAEMSNTGARTNVYGFYSLSIPTGQHQLVYRYSGYEEQVFDLYISQDTVINIELFLSKEVQEIEAVDITSKRSNSNI